jgi:hypothetical protein
MNSNLKVGSNNAGLFVGNTEILGGGDMTSILVTLSLMIVILGLV